MPSTGLGGTSRGFKLNFQLENSIILIFLHRQVNRETAGKGRFLFFAALSLPRISKDTGLSAHGKMTQRLCTQGVTKHISQ